MQVTGIVRRIDELGRIVIPKEIRRTLRIKDGDTMEIYTDNGRVVLQKYSALSVLQETALDYTESIASITGFTCCICDLDNVIAIAYGSMQPLAVRQNLSGKILDPQMEDCIRFRSESVIHITGLDVIPVTIGDDFSEYVEQVVIPITGCGETLGSLILLNKSNSFGVKECDIQAAQTIALVIGRQAEA